MNRHVLQGVFCDIEKKYRSKDGRHVFGFKFTRNGNRVDIYCPQHPSLNGKDSDPHKTHLFGSKKLCFVTGREPRNQSRAEALAGQWAEYFLEYRRTGRTQS